MDEAASALKIARGMEPQSAPKIKLHTGPIHSRVAGRTDHLPMRVPSGSYVIPADVLSGIGEGNTMAGFTIMNHVFGPAGNSTTSGDQGVPIVAAGGELVLSPQQVAMAGDGDTDIGHKVLDDFVKQVRAKIIKTMAKLPPPKRD